MSETQSKLDELRSLLRRCLHQEKKTKMQVADEAGLQNPGSKLTKLLGCKNGRSKPKGIDAESALRLWEYARSRPERDEKSPPDNDFPATIPPQAGNENSTASRGASSTWLVDVRQENKFRIPGDLGLVIEWLGSMTESHVHCIALVTGTGNRMILPRAHGIGRKIEDFNRSFAQPLRAEEILKSDTIRSLVSRYIGASWSLLISRTNLNEFEFEITAPQTAIKAGGEIEIWVSGPESLVLSDPGKIRNAELMELAQQFPELLDRALGIR